MGEVTKHSGFIGEIVTILSHRYIIYQGHGNNRERERERETITQNRVLASNVHSLHECVWDNREFEQDVVPVFGGTYIAKYKCMINWLN